RRSAAWLGHRPRLPRALAGLPDQRRLARGGDPRRSLLAELLRRDRPPGTGRGPALRQEPRSPGPPRRADPAARGPPARADDGRVAGDLRGILGAVRTGQRPGPGAGRPDPDRERWPG